MTMWKKWGVLMGVVALMEACHREPEQKSRVVHLSPGVEQEATKTKPGGARLTYGLELEATAPKDAREQARIVIKKRLKALNVDADVTIVGESIQVDITGATAEAVDEIQRNLLIGKLEIREVDDGPASDPLPPGMIEATATMYDGQKKQVRLRPATIGPGHVENASVQKDDFGYSIDVQLTEEGGKLFEKLSRENINRPVAIVLDGKVSSMPIVKSAITGGRVRITMGGEDLDKQKAEADALVRALQSGALPGRLIYESINIVPPLR